MLWIRNLQTQIEMGETENKGLGKERNLITGVMARAGSLKQDVTPPRPREKQWQGRIFESVLGFQSLSDGFKPSKWVVSHDWSFFLSQIYAFSNLEATASMTSMRIGATIQSPPCHDTCMSV